MWRERVQFTVFVLENSAMFARAGYPPPKTGGTAFFANPNLRNEWIGNHV